jgi:quercetin dioxygenase-like cupin family protein
MLLVFPDKKWAHCQMHHSFNTFRDLAETNTNLERMFDLGELTVGVMYVAPGCCYPLHAHPPHELYITLAGYGEWRYGGHDGFRTVAPDAVLYNHPGDLHSAVAGTTPLVALYVLWP